MLNYQVLPISALQHFVFCRRQCALIHIEQIWIENFFTASGRLMHERVHDEGTHTSSGIYVERGVNLYSAKLGLNGYADIVEFHRQGTKNIPFPVEYKKGKPKIDNCDKVQLCAQALCLEEMLGVNISSGALFYGKIRRRLDVLFDEKLRSETIEISEALHNFIKAGITPKPHYNEKCDTCSLVEICLPKKISSSESAKQYFNKGLEDL